MILTIEHLLMAFGDTLNDIRLLQISSILCLLISLIILFSYIYFIYVASQQSDKKRFFDRFKFLVKHRELVLKITTTFVAFILFISLLLYLDLNTRHRSIRENSQIIFQKIFSDYDGLTEEEIEMVKTNQKVRWYFERLKRDLFEQDKNR